MKKIIYVLICVLILTGCTSIKNKIEEKIDNIQKLNIPLMEFDKYKNFNIDEVKSLSILRYTEGGMTEEKIDNSYIKGHYNNLSKYKVVKPTNRACEDNTTVYQFTMKDNSKTSFEFECDWIVIGNMRYEVVKE